MRADQPSFFYASVILIPVHRLSVLALYCNVYAAIPLTMAFWIFEISFVGCSLSAYMILDERSPVEIFYDDFAEKHGGPTLEILRLSKELRRKFSNLSDECATAIFEDAALLCAEYERTGFHGCFRYGMKTTIENWSK